MLAEVHIRTWLPRMEEVYVTDTIGDTAFELLQESDAAIFSHIQFVENNNTPAQMQRLMNLVKKNIHLFYPSDKNTRIKVPGMVEEYIQEPPWEAPRSTRNPEAMRQELEAIDRRVALGMLQPASSSHYNTPLHNALDSMEDGRPKYRQTADTSRRKKLMKIQPIVPGVLSLEDTLRSIEKWIWINTSINGN